MKTLNGSVLFPIPGFDYKNKKEIDRAFKTGHAFLRKDGISTDITQFEKGETIILKFANHRIGSITKV